MFEQESERAWFKRQFAEFEDMMQETWVFREIGLSFFEKEAEQSPAETFKQGFNQGLELGLRQGIVSFLQTRFPEMLTLMYRRIGSIKDTKVLQAVLDKLLKAQTVEEVKQILLDVNKQQHPSIYKVYHDTRKLNMLGPDEFLQETGIYEDIFGEAFMRAYQEWAESGFTQGQYEMLRSFLQKRFPQVVTLVNPQNNRVKDPEVLRILLLRLYTAKTTEEAKQLLLDINKQ